MASFYVCGALFAVWAVTVSLLGVTRENFPASPASERLVGAISVVLAVAAIGTGIYTSTTEEEEHEDEAGEQALVLRI